jgi:hypothetical protein
MLTSVQKGSGKCARQGAKHSGRICTSHTLFELGNIDTAQKDILHMCSLKAYTGERAWKAIGDRLQREGTIMVGKLGAESERQISENIPL